MRGRRTGTERRQQPRRGDDRPDGPRRASRPPVRSARRSGKKRSNDTMPRPHSSSATTSACRSELVRIARTAPCTVRGTAAIERLASFQLARRPVARRAARRARRVRSPPRRWQRPRGRRAGRSRSRRRGRCRCRTRRRCRALHRSRRHLEPTRARDRCRDRPATPGSTNHACRGPLSRARKIPESVPDHHEKGDAVDGEQRHVWLRPRTMPRRSAPAFGRGVGQSPARQAQDET